MFFELLLFYLILSIKEMFFVGVDLEELKNA
jgi:hypothetical protein